MGIDTPGVEIPVHRALGLTDAEAGDIRGILGREPNHLELGMFSVMWSEHCSYKSSRLHLRRLPTEAEHVLVGPGENAGVVDVGDGIAVAMRIESHNHPSAIEPYQGAATGVGGILRDIFTMGARPIALMDPLRFGPLDDARSRWIADGVVSGVSGYGNAVGVPTVGGETVFDETYRGNPLVNVFCLGVLPHERLVLGQASGVGNLAVLLGSRTGRDGIGGVSVLASAGFDDTDDSVKRPSVQVGDPYEEKRLIEACLELLDANLVVGIQDLGGAGLTCATSETASRGGVGMDVYVKSVPLREAAMEPFEVMISESQERMLAICRPDDLDAVAAIARRWEVAATVIGTVTDGGALRILDCNGPEDAGDAAVLADVPAASLHEDAPLYDRPSSPAPVDFDSSWQPPDDLGAALCSFVCDTTWVWSQYDHQLFLNTVAGPGGDAAILRLKDPRSGRDTGSGLALTSDGNHRWCAVDPRAGTRAVVVEAASNLATSGARPSALVNCLNFGNPEHPEVMWQLSEAIDGMAEACVALRLPVIGGNVSLYNESNGRNIDPTPVVAALGVVDELSARPPGHRWTADQVLLLVGGGLPGLGGSQLAGRMVPEPLGSLDLDAAAAAIGVVASVVRDTDISAIHDVGSGGVALCVAEMAIASGEGARVTLARTAAPRTESRPAGSAPGDGVADDVVGSGSSGWEVARTLFGEVPGRFVIACTDAVADAIRGRAAEAGVPSSVIGRTGGSDVTFVVDDVEVVAVPVVTLREAAAGRLPDAFSPGRAMSSGEAV